MTSQASAGFAALVLAAASASYAAPGAEATQGQAATSGAKMEARLVDPEKKAAGQAATVEVKVSNLQLVDPASVGEKPNKDQGHLHYQVDDGPVVATPSSKLSFHGLTAGKHKIVVILAGNDHKPLGPETTLEVTVPAPKP